MKKILVLALICLLAGCSNGSSRKGNPAPESVSTSSEAEESAATSDGEEALPTEESQAFPTAAPSENSELYDLFMKQWKTGDVTRFYSYASDQIKSILDENEFQYMFCGNFSTFGQIKEVKNEKIDKAGSTEVHSGTLVLENVKIDYELTLRQGEIAGYFNNLRIVNPFEVKKEHGVTEYYSLLQSGDYLLNAVYVKAAQEDAPVAILIPGSGPNDYNESTGILTPFQDLAEDLAAKGISSLRFEKRTLRYGSNWLNTYGLEEEYFQDLESAYNWLTNVNGSKNVWLLGHSLGVNIAAEFSNRHPVEGMILWNGSARHLAEIAADQLAAQAPVTSEYYHALAENAKAVTAETSDGHSYFNCSDYYWATYNALDTISSIRKAGIPTLIINSRNDKQTFDQDIELWQSAFANDGKVTLRVFDDLSHFGYKIDGSTASFYQFQEFPGELTDEIVSFIKK